MSHLLSACQTLLQASCACHAKQSCTHQNGQAEAGYACSAVRAAHLNAEAQPEDDQMEWMRTGYTQALMKKEYRMYASKRVRSAMAPETMVQAVAANCRQVTMISSM